MNTSTSYQSFNDVVAQQTHTPSPHSVRRISFSGLLDSAHGGAAAAGEHGAQLSSSKRLSWRSALGLRSSASSNAHSSPRIPESSALSDGEDDRSSGRDELDEHERAHPAPAQPHEASSRGRLSELGLLGLTVGIGGAQLAWSVEMA